MKTVLTFMLAAILVFGTTSALRVIRDRRRLCATVARLTTEIVAETYKMPEVKCVGVEILKEIDPGVYRASATMAGKGTLKIVVEDAPEDVTVWIPWDQRNAW